MRQTFMANTGPAVQQDLLPFLSDGFQDLNSLSSFNALGKRMLFSK